MVLDSLPTHIAHLDDEGTIVSVNRAWREFGMANGARTEQAISVGVNYLAVCAAHSDDASARVAYEGVAAVLAGTSEKFEMELPCNSVNEERWFLMCVTPLLGPQGGAVVTHDNVTQRRQLAQQRASLVNELLDFRTALDAHAIVAITDGAGRITYVNDKFCSISKWSREELIGQDHRLISSGHHPNDYIRGMWTTIASGRIWKGELRNRAKDGSIYWVDTTIVPLMGKDGGPYQYTAIGAEITQRKLLEEHNAEIMDELLAANHELNDFAYVVSHDLKAPLRGISSLASWLVTDYAEQLGPEGRGHLDLIANRVKRLSLLIDAILTYSRAGRSREPRVPVALGPLVRNTVELLAPPPHVRVELAAEWPELTVEAVKIQQVFQNLLSNAIDFIDKPAGLVRVGCCREGSFWRFSVADNGAGIEPRHFERIFQLFQTLASRDVRERTGVGLALAKKIVELEGGRIWVESVPGAGSTFHFSLPCSPAGSPGKAREPA